MMVGKIYIAALIVALVIGYAITRSAPPGLLSFQAVWNGLHDAARTSSDRSDWFDREARGKDVEWSGRVKGGISGGSLHLIDVEPWKNKSLWPRSFYCVVSDAEQEAKAASIKEGSIIRCAGTLGAFFKLGLTHIIVSDAIVARS